MRQPAHYLSARDWENTSQLPTAWRWDPAWAYAKRLTLSNRTAHARVGEPVEVEAFFHASQAADLHREVRVLRATDTGVEQVPSQICCQEREDDALRARLFFLADVPAHGEQTYLVLYGNPKAMAPELETDLTVTGEGYALEIENRYFRTILAPSNGNLKSLYPTGWQSDFVGAGPPMDGGHGVEGTIHWGPDWSDESVGRYRLTSWDGPQLFDYEVIRGPVCVRVRRWGHPILSIGPNVGRPHRVTATVTYTIYAGQPYVIMESELDVLQDTGFRDCRNDEWVIGGDLPEVAWMEANGTIGFGSKGWSGQDPRWMTFFHRETGEAFGSLHLEFTNTHPSWEQPETVAIQEGGIWVRYPVRHAVMRQGDFVYERNAQVLHHFEEGGRDSGFGELVDHQKRLSKPLVQVAIQPGTRPLSLDNVYDALRAVTDFELYVEGSPSGPRQLSVVDLGMVRDVQIRDGVVTVKLIMPYAGRDTWFGWFANRVREQINLRLEGVDDIDVQQVREPAWAADQMNDRARRIIGPNDVIED
jgi:metal-sulfur cluster biosynthetic enzyme